MSLIDDAMTACVLYDKSRKADGEGGYITAWVESVEFKAAITFDSSMEARVGEKAGVTSLYTVTLAKGIELNYHDVFKRVEDGKIFRVTSDGDDELTPAKATIQFKQVTAEEWRLTT